jgi:acid phosphatase
MWKFFRKNFKITIVGTGIVVFSTILMVNTTEKNLIFNKLNNNNEDANIMNRIYPSNLILKQIQLITRHGDRTPISSWKPNNTTSKWVCRGIIGEDDEQLCEHIHYELVLGKKIPNHLVHIKDELDNPHDKENLHPQHINKECYRGQLTTKGKEQMFKIGENLRKIYIEKLNFLNDYYNNEEIFIRSTNIPRTKQSEVLCFHCIQ